MPDVLKNTVPYALEAATKGQFNKGHYKRFRFDFYKADGRCEAEKVLMKPEKRQKKGIITYFGLCLGASIEIEVKLPDHSFKRVVHSGEAFMVDQTVQQVSVGVSRVIAREHPLTMREGGLLVQVEKD